MFVFPPLYEPVGISPGASLEPVLRLRLRHPGFRADETGFGRFRLHGRDSAYRATDSIASPQRVNDRMAAPESAPGVESGSRRVLRNSVATHCHAPAFLPASACKQIAY